MSSILIYHPLGLGDHIVCSGIVREYAKKFDHVGVVCLQKFLPSISYLYDDLPQVSMVPITSHRDIQKYRKGARSKSAPLQFDRILQVRVLDEESGIQYEKQLYHSASVSLEKMWDNFYIERNLHTEAILTAQAGVPNIFAFVHDDARFPLDQTKLPSVPLFYPSIALTQNMFAYCGLIEKAQEIHVIDSSFMFLVDCLDYTNNEQKLFVHRYARPNVGWNLPILKKPWKILV